MSRDFWEWFEDNAADYLSQEYPDILEKMIQAFKFGWDQPEYHIPVLPRVPFVIGVIELPDVDPVPPPKRKPQLPKNFEKAFLDYMNKKLEERNEKDN